MVFNGKPSLDGLGPSYPNLHTFVLQTFHELSPSKNPYRESAGLYVARRSTQGWAHHAMIWIVLDPLGPTLFKSTLNALLSVGPALYCGNRAAGGTLNPYLGTSTAPAAVHSQRGQLECI